MNGLKSLDDFLLEGKANGKRSASASGIYLATTGTNLVATGLPFRPSTIVWWSGTSAPANYIGVYTDKSPQTAYLSSGNITSSASLYANKSTAVITDSGFTVSPQVQGTFSWIAYE